MARSPDEYPAGGRQTWWSGRLPDEPGINAGRAVVLHTRVVTASGGGPDKTILLSAPFLAHTRYFLAAAYMHPPDDPGFETILERARRVGCPMIGVDDGGPLDRRPLQRLLEICRRLNVRIWHGHDYKSNLFGLLLRPFWNMKLVTTVHGWVHNTTRTPLYYAIDRWSLPFYHRVICVSDDLAGRVRGVGVPPQRISLIHNAIDERTFRRCCPPGEAPMRKQLGTPAQRLVFGAVGRLSPEKAFNNLIRAAAALLERGVDLEVWIAGEGDSRRDLETMIQRLGLQARIRLLGFVQDTVGLYEAMDGFVLSSIREGLPNVVLEAASMQVPIVATRVAGIPAMLRDGEDALLCPIGDVEALVGAMGRLADDAALRNRLAAAGRSLIEQRYSFTRRMQKVKAIYDELLGYPVDEPAEGAAIRGETA